MQFVIDTSAIVAVLVEEPERPAIIAATTEADLLAPASLPWELGNALVAMVRRRRLTPADATEVWTSYESIPLRFMDVDVGEAITTANKVGLYAYDAYMIVLARRMNLPLLTLDQRLQTVARSLGITIVNLEES